MLLVPVGYEIQFLKILCFYNHHRGRLSILFSPKSGGGEGPTLNFVLRLWKFRFWQATHAFQFRYNEVKSLSSVERISHACMKFIDFYSFKLLKKFEGLAREANMQMCQANFQFKNLVFVFPVNSSAQHAYNTQHK